MGRSQSVPRGTDRRFGPEADDTGCPILHVDMDAFFASVELRRRPRLRGRPVVVGGTAGRGVVCSATYEARAYGVRSAMPTSRARALCPQAVFLPPDFPAYAEASRQVMRIFQDVTPLVEPLSLDEAFLDVSGARRLLGRPVELATLLRRRIVTELALTCSVGVAPNKFLAKLGSTRAKPDGLVVVPADQITEFLHPLPVEALWGVGERSAQQLRRAGVTTVGELARAPLGLLRALMGQAAAAHLHELAHGRDPRPVRPDQPEKSIGAEVTFDRDVTDLEAVRRTLLELAGRVGARLRRAGLAARTVSVKVRYADFRTVSRSRTLGGGTDVTREVFTTVWSLFRSLGDPPPVRLVGVRLTGLVDGAAVGQQPVLGEREHGWREAETAADRVVARFGPAAVRPAILLESADPDHPENVPGSAPVPLSDRPAPS